MLTLLSPVTYGRKVIYSCSMGGRQAMKLIYKLRWVFVALTAVAWVMAFALMFVGGSAIANRILLAINLSLILVQIINIIIAYKHQKRDTAVAVAICLLISFGLMWVTYICSWSYTVKAMTMGFD